MQVTPGFVTLAICGLVAVVLPSLALGWRAWRQGRSSRASVVLCGVFAAAMTGLVFVGTEQLQSWDVAVLAALLSWGVCFHALTGLSHVLRTGVRCWLTRRSGGPLRGR